MTKEQAIEYIYDRMEYASTLKDKSAYVVLNMVLEEIEQLEDRPKGEWEITQGGNYLCNNCYTVSEREYDFCPNCGADMRESEVEE